MRRNDTSIVGDLAEAEAARLMRERGYHVENLNEMRRNHPTYDLLAIKEGVEFKVSVKCARAKRDLSLGTPSSVRRLEPGNFVMAFLPTALGRECAVETGEYELWIIPAEAVLADALGAHDHYWSGQPEKADGNTVRVKDKIDRAGGRSRSGAVFKQWANLYRDGWGLLPG